MITGLFKALDHTFAIPTPTAKCDIPCNINDPIVAQVAGLSLQSFIDLIKELNDKPQLTAADNSQLSRLTREKDTLQLMLKKKFG
jgi:nickel superoxide dismutase